MIVSNQFYFFCTLLLWWTFALYIYRWMCLHMTHWTAMYCQIERSSWAVLHA